VGSARLLIREVQDYKKQVGIVYEQWKSSAFTLNQTDKQKVNITNLGNI
jgi:hypothetical protein